MQTLLLIILHGLLILAGALVWLAAVPVPIPT